LTQCISNLLANAVKFVPPGVMPEIRVWSETRGERVILFFADNGIGIAQHSHDRIFDIFRTLDHSSGGTGIGLAIVRKAVHKMNGQVGLDSEPGKGSTFWLDLPSAPP